MGCAYAAVSRKIRFAKSLKIVYSVTNITD